MSETKVTDYDRLHIIKGEGKRTGIALCYNFIITL